VRIGDFGLIHNLYFFSCLFVILQLLSKQ